MEDICKGKALRADIPCRFFAFCDRDKPVWQMTCLAVMNAHPQPHAGEMTSGLRYRRRNCASPMFSLRSWVTDEISALDMFACTLGLSFYFGNEDAWTATRMRW